MVKQFKYYINGKEIETREEFLDNVMLGEFVTTVDGDTVSAIFIADFFAENKDNNRLVKRNFNDFLKENQGMTFMDEVINTNSTRHKSRDGETHKEVINPPSDKQTRIDNLITNGKNCRNGSLCFCDGSCKEDNKVGISVFRDNTVTSEENKKYFNYINDLFENNKAKTIFTEDTILGKKEENGKLNYELDWEFIEQLAKRMSKNKSKYKPYNWKEPIDVEKLKQSLIRHIIEVMKGNYEDDGDEFGHILAISLNAMMINYQLKLNKS